MRSAFSLQVSATVVLCHVKLMSGVLSLEVREQMQPPVFATEVIHGIMVPSLFCISKSGCLALDCALIMVLSLVLCTFAIF